jgi:hypothetical protein
LGDLRKRPELFVRAGGLGIFKIRRFTFHW